MDSRWCGLSGFAGWLLLGLIGLAVTFSHAAASSDVCVSSVNALRSALQRANTEDDLTIRVVQGNYELNEYIDTDGVEDLRLLGGYTENCTGRSLDPRLTIIRSVTREVVQRFSLSVGGDLVVESLSFENYCGSIHLSASDFFDGETSHLIVSRVQVKDSGGCLYPAASIDGEEATVTQSLFVHNLTGAEPCAVASYAEHLVFAHNVVAANFGPGFCALGFHGDEVTELYNNILWDNGGPSLHTENSDQVILRDNIVDDTDLNPPPAMPPQGTINADPMFVNAAGGFFAVTSASPAINSGTEAVPGGLPAKDIVGSPRLIGSRPDRGAYESGVDDALVLTVTNTSDVLSPPTPGSLRFAMLAANSDPGYNEIRFNIAGGCPRIVNLVAPLPDVLETLKIDGFTQPGSVVNSTAYTGVTAGINADPCIAIRGNGASAHAFQVPNNGTATFKVQGLALGGFTTAAIRLTGGEGHKIWGNQFGGSLGNGAVSLGTSTAHLRIGGSSKNIQIGGADPELRNLFAGASGHAIEILPSTPSDSTGNWIEGNLIGTTPSSLTADGNGNGVLLATANNTVLHNVMSGNATDGLVLQGAASHHNDIRSNKIGTTGTLNIFGNDLPNGRHGIFIDVDAASNTITGNSIRFNGAAGVRVQSGQRISIRGNAISDNDALGIDTANVGNNSIDNDASAVAQAQSNRGLNHPLLASAQWSNNVLSVIGLLSTTNGVYYLDFYASNSCDVGNRGEGAAYVGSSFATITNAPTGDNGSALIEASLPTLSNLSTKYITATATDSLGNTSEFSDCELIPPCRDIFRDSLEDQPLPLTCSP